MRNHTVRQASPVVALMLGTLILGCQEPAADAQEVSTPTATPAPATDSKGLATAFVSAERTEAAGRYLIEVAGCNDCHTEGFLMTGGKVPESEWLKGSVVGFNGPWGTTYPSNLRLTVARMTEDQWVDMLHTRTSMPPMPWMSVAAMSDADRRAIYRYIRSLGEPGDAAPANLAPGVEPTTPWLDFVPKNLPESAGAPG